MSSTALFYSTGPLLEVSLVEFPALTHNLTWLDDGRVDVDLNSRFCRALSHFIPHAKSNKTDAPGSASHRKRPDVDETYGINQFPIKLNIVIQVAGSRGDVQPFVAFGNELQRHGHRVRLATHDIFESFVHGAGLEFFPIGGDPLELMSYMVRNPGLIPSIKSLRRGDIRRKRVMVAEMLRGFWRSCIEKSPYLNKPFVADAIIANPPSFAHVHCAQALKIPVHLMFTMPWTSTGAFSHPLANLDFKKSAMLDAETANYISYSVVEWMTWQGLGGIINDWRRILDLEPVPLAEGPLLVETLEIPFTYCWSPALVKKPSDWPPHVDVCGFFFREVLDYTPQPDLAEFLSQGPPPIYIGFGSIVIDDPAALTRTLLDTVHQLGTRAIISRGWSHLNSESENEVFFVGDCPHEWLFARVSAVVHHGGAGTTACGLANGRPTTIVPFFGDQSFWGDMVAASGAGPNPIPYRELNVEKLSEAIRFCLAPEVSAAAANLALKMKSENGVVSAPKSFHANLPQENLRCDILKSQPASWACKRAGRRIKISKLAAGVLFEHLKIDEHNFTINETKKIVIKNRRIDPVSGLVSALIGTTAGMTQAASEIILATVPKLHMHNETTTPSENAVESASPSTKTCLSSSSTSQKSENKNCARVNTAQAMTHTPSFRPFCDGFGKLPASKHVEEIKSACYCYHQIYFEENKLLDSLFNKENYLDHGLERNCAKLLWNVAKCC